MSQILTKARLYLIEGSNYVFTHEVLSLLGIQDVNVIMEFELTTLVVIGERTDRLMDMSVYNW